VNKNKQKNFAPGGWGKSVATTPLEQKFLVLFFKKEPLSFP
jgi:hypothetical protein